MAPQRRVERDQGTGPPPCCACAPTRRAPRKLDRQGLTGTLSSDRDPLGTLGTATRTAEKPGCVVRAESGRKVSFVHAFSTRAPLLPKSEVRPCPPGPSDQAQIRESNGGERTSPSRPSAPDAIARRTPALRDELVVVMKSTQDRICDQSAGLRRHVGGPARREGLVGDPAQALVWARTVV